MLTIRKDQIAVLEENLKENFLENTIMQLRSNYAEVYKNLTIEEILEFISEGIEKAAKYNIEEREDVYSFLEYMTCFGKEFYVNPANGWAVKVFRIRNLPGKERIIRLKNNKPLTKNI